MACEWKYEDATGVERRGIFLDFYDRGGTDVTYKFHRLDEAGNPICFENGGKRIDMVSGARLKKAERIWNK